MNELVRGAYVMSSIQLIMFTNQLKAVKGFEAVTISQSWLWRTQRRKPVARAKQITSWLREAYLQGDVEAQVALDLAVVAAELGLRAAGIEHYLRLVSTKRSLPRVDHQAQHPLCVLQRGA